MGKFFKYNLIFTWLFSFRSYLYRTASVWLVSRPVLANMLSRTEIVRDLTFVLDVLHVKYEKSPKKRAGHRSDAFYLLYSYMPLLDTVMEEISINDSSIIAEDYVFTRFTAKTSIYKMKFPFSFMLYNNLHNKFKREII